MTNDALIEAMARAACAAVEENPDEIYGVDKRPAWTFLLDEMKAAIAVCRQIIEAETREKCARIAEMNGDASGLYVAAAIRSDGND